MRLEKSKILKMSSDFFGSTQIQIIYYSFLCNNCSFLLSRIRKNDYVGNISRKSVIKREFEAFRGHFPVCGIRGVKSTPVSKKGDKNAPTPINTDKKLIALSPA